jgi:adenine phosphoribosyltransferase
MANSYGLPFVMVRKKGAKYPGKLLEESYELEYGTDTIVLQEGVLGHTSRVIIVDDLVATGGTLLATKKLIEQTGARVLSCATIVNLKYLNKFKDIEVVSLYEPTK